MRELLANALVRLALAGLIGFGAGYGTHATRFDEVKERRRAAILAEEVLKAEQAAELALRQRQLEELEALSEEMKKDTRTYSDFESFQ